MENDLKESLNELRVVPSPVNTSQILENIIPVLKF